jgi:hypothetical protein
VQFFGGGRRGKSTFLDLPQNIFSQSFPLFSVSLGGVFREDSFEGFDSGVQSGADGWIGDSQRSLNIAYHSPTTKKCLDERLMVGCEAGKRWRRKLSRESCLAGDTGQLRDFQSGIAYWAGSNSTFRHWRTIS